MNLLREFWFYLLHPADFWHEWSDAAGWMLQLHPGWCNLKEERDA